MGIKSVKRAEGIVANTNLEKALSRQLFLQADPAFMAAITASDAQEFFAGGDFFSFDPKELLQYLPDLEAEIVHLLYVCGKNQKDVGEILNLSQPTISSKYHRALLKIRYLTLINGINLELILKNIPGMEQEELDILLSLFFTANQEFTASRCMISQSKVRYVFRKFYDILLDLEEEEPLKWANAVGIFFFMKRFMRLRIHTEKNNGHRSELSNTGPAFEDS